VGTPDSSEPLTPQEVDLADMFYGTARDHAAETFDEVANRVLGPAMFDRSKNVSEFRIECQNRYDLAHKDLAAE
jgi:hypothetical protein